MKLKLYVNFVYINILNIVSMYVNIVNYIYTILCIGRCQDWIYACDRLDLLCATAEATYTKLFYLKLGLCEDHFDEQSFEQHSNQVLHIAALPKLFWAGPGKYFEGDTKLS